MTHANDVESTGGPTTASPGETRDEPTSQGAHRAVATGQEYARRLADAGGREMQAFARDSDALAVAMYASPPYDVEVPPLEVARLSVNLSHSHVDGALDGAPTRHYVARRHSLFLTPAGASANWRKDASSRHINIYFHAGAFARNDDVGGGSLLADATPWLNGMLVGAGPLFEMLADEFAQPAAHREEAVDSLARLILLRVARQRSQRGSRANPLSPAVLRRVADFVEAQLTQGLYVVDLAAVAGLPPNRFAQAFAQATGGSPHQFVLRKRLERAVHLLRHSTQPLADVAAACGFASQQHMTHVMRQRLGVTPARCRAEATEVQPNGRGERLRQARKTT